MPYNSQLGNWLQNVRIGIEERRIQRTNNPRLSGSAQEPLIAGWVLDKEFVVNWLWTKDIIETGLGTKSVYKQKHVEALCSNGGL